MRVYIVTYRYMADKERGIWTSERISQEAYTSLEKAQKYIRSHPEHPVKVTEMYYVTDNHEEYYIHDVLVRGCDYESKEAAAEFDGLPDCMGKGKGSLRTRNDQGKR